MSDPKDCLLTAAEIAAMPERHHRHQFNDNAVRLTRTLGEAVGLTRIGLHLVRLEPGRDSTQHHYHDADEEFIYVLSGRGVACIGEATFEVGPGDCMGFPAPGPAHSLTNPGDEDLVYLVGGERNAVDAVHYPRIGRSMLKAHGRKRWVDWPNLHDVDPV
ncbi:MAG: cupin domain-containing protein [Pseudomonadales bacterium]